MSDIVKSPATPYYAVIFTSKRTLGDNGYDKAGDDIISIAARFDGFLGAESLRDKDGFGITVSYWDSLESIDIWKNNMTHMQAKEKGKKHWYEAYMIRVCKVESDNYFLMPTL